MKGIVFTEFLEMVEDHFSIDMVDNLIDDCDLPSGGAYTAVGTYSHEEIVALVSALSQRTAIPVPQLLKVFGEHLFGQFAKNYSLFFVNVSNALDFLHGIEDVIHAEVKKLYPDAQLPRFITEEYSNQKLVLVYQSNRHFEDLAEGLIIGCIKYFNEKIHISREEIYINNIKQERFTLVRYE